MEKTFEQKLTEAKQNVSSVSPEQANTQKSSDADIVFLDPRDVADIKATTGIIPGALNVSLNDLNELAINDLPEELAEQSRTIITACQAGPMGALAAHALKKRGYENVQFIDGGTQAWIDAGFSTH